MPKKIGIRAVQHDPLHNLKMLTEKRNDEKLVITLSIVGTGLIAYHFWQKINGISTMQVGAAVVHALALRVSRLTEHGAKERKRHDLALEKIQRARDEWNRD